MDRLGDGRRAVRLEGREAEPQEDPGLRSEASDPRCVDRILATLARRAYRRPVHRLEVAALKRVRRRWRKADGQSVEQGIALAIQAMLVSPHFLFHIERDLEPDRPEPGCTGSPTSSWPRGSATSCGTRCPTRSCCRWPSADSCSVPAGARRAGEADAGRSEGLRDGRELRRPVAGDPQPRHASSPIRRSSRSGTPELRDAMKTETRMFFDYMLRENRPIGEFLDARYTFLNEQLAKLLRHRRRHGPGFPARRAHDQRARRRAEPGQRARRVQLSDADVGRDPRQVHPAEHPRHAAAAAAARRAAARRRGGRHHRVAAQADGEASRRTPSAPPATRAWIRSASRWRTTMPSAGGGRWTAGSRWIRAASCRAARSFRRPAEMRKILSQRLPEFSRTLTEKLLIYALGRGLERYDKPTVRDITKRARGLRLRLPDAGARGRAKPAVPVTAGRSGANGRGDEIARRGLRAGSTRVGVWAILGSSDDRPPPFVRKWRNWQTRKPQELVAARSWRFKSSLPHHC